MRKITLLAISIFCCTIANAQQPWLKQFDNNNNSKIKLSDVVAAWKSNPANNDESAKEAALASGEEEKEDMNYQFDRWVAFWSQHLDDSGYMVPQSKLLQEWRKYNGNNRLNNLSKKTATASNWTFQGPDTCSHYSHGIGRQQSIGFHPTDSNTFWTGSAAGGAWKTTDGGKTWTCMTDNSFPVLGVSCITYNPKNPNTIYLCTGDHDGGDNYGYGIFKSYDGGVTWDTTGLSWTYNMGAYGSTLLVNPLDTNSILVATSRGIYKSFNGGTSFIQVQPGEFKQIVYRPNDTNYVYASRFYHSAGGGSIVSGQIYRSADGGNTWTQQTSFTSVIRIALAVTPANQNMVKAVTSNTAYGLEAVYSSSDTGTTFKRIYNADAGCNYNLLSFDPKLRTSSCGGQGWYDLCIAISPLDSNSVFVGGVNTWHSTDGGLTWNIVNQWTGALTGIITVHADKHFLSFNPITPTTLYECNDGGLYKTYNPTSLFWYDLTNGVHTTEFYRIAVSDNAHYVIGGAQDNGSKMLLSPTTSKELTGADGMDVQIDPVDSNTFYTSYYYGSIFRTTDWGTTYTNISKNIPGTPSGAWTTPFIVRPDSTNVIYAGFTNLFATRDQGASWLSISPGFTANASRVALSPANPGSIYVLSSKIWFTNNFGNTWTNAFNPYPAGVMSDIVADPDDTNQVYISYSGFTANKVLGYNLATKVVDTLNDGIPNVPVFCMAIDRINHTKYIGTSLGIWYRQTSMTSWLPFNTGLPIVEVYDLKLNYNTDELWAATFGRGVWKSPKNITTKVSTVPFLNDILSVYPNPSNGHFTINTSNAAMLNKTMNAYIINIAGQIVWQGTSNFDNSGNMKIDAGNIANGSYILQLTSDGAIAARKKLTVLR